MNIRFALNLLLILPLFACEGKEDPRDSSSLHESMPINSTEQMPFPPQYLYNAHPWHGIALGERAPEVVNCFVEIIPTDTVKYEIDKASGHLMIDRPHKYSSLCPTLYGFIPRTYAGKRVGDYMSEKTGNKNLYGDGDGLDVCILTEKTISHGNIIVKAIPIGGFRLIDGNEADDKIIAVLEGDFLYGNLKDISECPPKVIERLRHYFLTYKDAPERGANSKIQITEIYGRNQALEVIRLGYFDYLDYVSQ